MARGRASSRLACTSLDRREPGCGEASHGSGGTMAALILGLLVSSAKDTYDTKRTEVIQMAAKIAFLDRVLAAYGAEAAET